MIDLNNEPNFWSFLLPANIVTDLANPTQLFKKNYNC